MAIVRHGAHRTQELDTGAWCVRLPATLETDVCVALIDAITLAAAGVVCLSCDDVGVRRDGEPCTCPAGQEGG